MVLPLGALLVGVHCGKLTQEGEIGLDKTAPELSPTCADTGVNGKLTYGECEAWVTEGGHCGKSWADEACPKTCGICQLCTLGSWGDWSACTSTCGGGGQVRTQDPGNCGAGYVATSSQQCNTDLCAAGPDCTLSPSPPLMITDDNTVVENKIITVTSGTAPAIWVYEASNVTLRNIKIVHAGSNRSTGAVDGRWVDQSGAGIFFQRSPNVKIENVHVSLVTTPNPHATGDVCDTQYCGPFPYDMKYAYNIYGQDSEQPTLSNVFVTGGSTGFWCKNCPYGKVSHFRAENLHGPYPRGQCFQVESCTGFILEDFACIQDNHIAFTEDDISVWNSSYAIVQRGYIQGGNAPNGVGVISEMSDHTVVQDVDVTLVGGTCFSAYGANNVTFLRTRAKANHADAPNTCLAAHGFCKDKLGLFPNSQIYVGDQSVPDKTCCGDGELSRCDTRGGIWFAGDYTSDQAGGAHNGYDAANVAIKEGVFSGMTRIESSESYTQNGHCVNIDTSDWAASNADRQEAYIQKDFTEEDFTLRTPFVPTFCFPTN